MDAVEPKSSSDSLPWRISNNLASWYFVGTSAELAEGATTSAFLGEKEIVLFRSEGKVHALDPYCTHMGAKLCQGRVDQGHLVCPLHGWRFKGDGRVAGGTQHSRAWPVAERMGAILVFYGPEALYEPPSERPELHWGGLRESLIDAPWFSLTANAFDTHHYEAVHRRRLLAEPELAQPDPWTFACSYVSEVTGHQASDRLMRWLAPDGIRVTMTCYGGTLFSVNSLLGQREASLLVGMTPRGDQTLLRMTVGTHHRGFSALMARYLYTSFLRSDLKPMTGIRLQPFTGLAVDAVIERFARYLESLPEVD